MEVLDVLAQSGVQPRRTLYVAFGHDEEVSHLSMELILKYRSEEVLK